MLLRLHRWSIHTRSLLPFKHGSGVVVLARVLLSSDILKNGHDVMLEGMSTLEDGVDTNHTNGAPKP